MGQGSGVAVSCGVGLRCGLDPALLWLWPRLADEAPIQPLVWEPPYALSVALKRQTNQSPSFSRGEVDIEQSEFGRN